MDATVGYLYVLSNKYLKNKDGLPIYKIGFAKDMPKRLGTLNTSMPDNFKVDRVYRTIKYKELEDYVKKAFKGLSIKTEIGGSTEFYDMRLCEITAKIDSVRKLCDANREDGSIYVGRSASAISRYIKEHQKPETIIQPPLPLKATYNNKTALAKAIAEKAGKPSAANGIALFFAEGKVKRRCVKTSIWRKPLEEAGVIFDKNDFVIDWQHAKI